MRKRGDYLLRVENLSVSYIDTYALYKVNLRVKPGESLLVIGPSGSGKTTFLRCISGIIPNALEAKVEGVIEVLGLDPRTEFSRVAQRIVYLPQEPWDGITTPYVWSEIMLFVTSLEIVEILKNINLDEGYIYRSTFTLSAGEQQRLLLSLAFSRDSHLILADEPFSYLDPDNTRTLLTMFKKLVDKGVSTLVVDHDIERWKGIVDRVAIFENGKLIYVGSIEDAPRYPEYHCGIHIVRHRILGSTLLRVRNLWFRYPDSYSYILQDLSLDVHRGEIVVIKGASGCGKTTLLKLLAGLLKPTKGIIERMCNLLYVPENPLLFFSEPTVYDEVTKVDRGLGEELLRAFSLWNLRDRPIAKLSVGERKRVAIASAIARKTDLLLLDEPTAGLDPMNKKVVIDTIINAIESYGIGIVVATHDEDLQKLGDQIIDLGRGYERTR